MIPLKGMPHLAAHASMIILQNKPFTGQTTHHTSTLGEDRCRPVLNAERSCAGKRRFLRQLYACFVPCLVMIIQGYRYLGHRDNRWLSTSGDVPIRVVILCSVYAVPWVSWCDAVERRGTVLVVWIFFTSTIACLGVISTPDRSRSTHFEIVSGNACFGQLSTEMFSFITSSASCSRSRRTSGRNQPSTKD